jgi:hypothetical protein
MGLIWPQVEKAQQQQQQQQQQQKQNFSKV